MENTRKKIKAVIFIVVPIIVIAAVVLLVKKYMPSREVVDLEARYPLEEGEVLLVMQDEISEVKGRTFNQEIYIDLDTVVSFFNKRFYFDEKENLLIYTTPTETIKAEVGSSDYFINKSKKSFQTPIVKVEGGKVYIAVSYVEQFSPLETTLFEKPNRLVCKYKFNQEYRYASIKKETKLRTGKSIKKPILKELQKDDEVTILSKKKAESDKFLKVITGDGIIGYVERKRLSGIESRTETTDYEEPVYASISKDYKINLVFHQTFNQDANNNLLNLLDTTKGVTTLVPTWFSIANNSGEITSIASDTYVTRAHNAGLEVWGLCDDFDKDNVDMGELLSRTSTREKLENELIAAAIKHELDGINIDFERITESVGKDFIQFIRELSIKCRSNGIVLSIDNYPPAYTAYYDREEQGIVADYVITMAYDEYNGASKESGPVSSVNYVKDAIANTLKEVPKEKMIMAIPFYTRLWKEVKSGESVEVTSTAYGMQSGLNVLTDHGVTPVWDDAVGMKYGEFEADQALYRMWVEDEESIEFKMKAISEADTAGVAGWKLGLESPGIWDIIIKYVN